MVKRKFVKTSKSLKLLWKWLSEKFSFAFISLLTASIDKNSHILARIYFIFLENILKQIWKSFNTKFWPQWKDRKSRYEVRQILALFCNLTALILGYNYVKELKVTKIVKEVKFEGVWGKLEAKNVSRDNHSQNIWD